jgi:type IV pilus biogenesis protein PilP
MKTFEKVLVFAALLFICVFGCLSSAFADPCPVPQVALSETPNDLAKIQADIDRYALCVERAQLLQRLNNLALENGQNMTGMNPGFMLDHGKLAISGKDLGTEEEQEKDVPDEWQVLEIYGTLGKLQAKVMKAGIIIQVAEGEDLPGGKTVAAISPNQVTVMDGGKGPVNLDWVE